MLLTQFIKPEIPGLRRGEDRGKRLRRDDLFDPTIGFRVIQLPDLFRQPVIHHGHIFSPGVTPDHVLPEHLERSQFAQPPHTSCHCTSTFRLAVEFQQSLKSSAMRTDGVYRVHMFSSRNRLAQQMENGGVTGSRHREQPLSR